MAQYTEMRFASFLSGGFTNMEVINPPENKLAKRTSVQYVDLMFRWQLCVHAHKNAT